MAVCPYNASHHIPKSEERAHLLECRDRRIVEMQKYNEPLPGHHGNLANPPFYGSTLIPRQYVEEQESLPVALDDTQSSIISTFSRHRDLRSRVEPRPSAARSPGMLRRQPLIEPGETGTTPKIHFGRERAPLRRPVDTSRPPSPIEGITDPYFSHSRRTSPATTPFSYGNHGIRGRKSSPSPVRKIPEVGRLVPRRRSNSPSVASTAYQSYRG